MYAVNPRPATKNSLKIAKERGINNQSAVRMVSSTNGAGIIGLPYAK